MLDVPQDLRVDGATRPLDIGPDAPVLSWRPDPAQRAVRVVVTDDHGKTVWDSGPVATDKPEIRYAGPPLTSRTTYRWKVCASGAAGSPSLWSEPGRWETPLLQPDDWTAQWIGRQTPAERRIIRSIDSDHVAWIEEGHWAGQALHATGPVTAITADLTSIHGQETTGRLELCTADGAVLAVRPLHGRDFPWDRFAHYIEVDPPAPAGDLLIRVHADHGRIGWRTSSHPPIPADPDDGVSPLPVIGTALRDGTPEPGVRAVGAETAPEASPLFRTEFPVDRDASVARLHAVGLGYGSFSVNGVPVTDDILEPAPSAYDRTIRYRTYDVTHLLRTGTNTITAELGRGFFAARGASTWAWNLAPWHREPILLAQLEYTDRGGAHVLGTGSDWETTAGPVAADVLYTGLTYGPATAPWEPAILVTPPGGSLRPAGMPPIRRFDSIQATSSHRLDETTVVHDFGTVLAGRVRCRLTGPAGAEVIVRYGESLSPDGSVECDNVLVAGEAQVDRYVFTAGSGPVGWEPDHTYKGFRYVSTTVTAGVEVQQVEAIPVHTDVARTGAFACADETLTWTDAATARTFLNNLHGIPTDTPVYEKNGWTADAHLATEAVLHHFDLRASLGKWLDDHVDAQAADGTVPQIVPTPGWGRAPDPAWSASMVLIPWNLYWEYGDLEILRRFAGPALAYTDRMLEIAGGGLWPLHSWGDWLAPGHQFAPEGPAPTATMMLLHTAQRTALICRELGRTGDADRYTAAARDLATAYHQAYFDERTGSYRNGDTSYRQSMNVLPLAFAAVPAQHRDAVEHGLVHDIEHRTKGHLDCGAIGTKYLLPVLSDLGRDDLAVTVATQRTAPGWEPWRRAGSDTLMESWDDTARSHDHYFLGSVSAWIQQHAGALKATAPGWAGFDVQPIDDDRVPWGRLTHTTVRGEAAVDWRRRDDGWHVELTVPAGATATVLLPGTAPTTVSAGRHHVRSERLEVSP